MRKFNLLIIMAVVAVFSFIGCSDESGDSTTNTEVSDIAVDGSGDAATDTASDIAVDGSGDVADAAVDATDTEVSDTAVDGSGDVELADATDAEGSGG